MSQVDPNSYPRPYYYSSSRQNNSNKPLKPKGRKKYRRLVGATVLGLILIGLGVYGFHGKNNPVKKTVSSVVSLTKKKPNTSSQEEEPSLEALDTMSQTINSVIDQNNGIDISVNLINLNNNQAVHYGVNQTFQAASTAKILTAAYYLHQVEAGQESLGETINGNTAEYELQQMIVVSDDNAWAALNEDLGYNNLQNYADTTLGINDYQAYNNSLSSGDIALALQKLWQGNLLNSSNTQLLLSYMKQANYRQYIVPAVPSYDTIYHKIGLYEDYVNDAAIITHNQQTFVIVIFTNGNGTYSWPERAATMQEITKAALKAYFNQVV
jgi:beta-lactamase class A